MGGLYARARALPRRRVEGRSTTSTGRASVSDDPAPRGGGRDPVDGRPPRLPSPGSSDRPGRPPARRTRTVCAAPPPAFVSIAIARNGGRLDADRVRKALVALSRGPAGTAGPTAVIGELERFFAESLRNLPRARAAPATTRSRRSSTWVGTGTSPTPPSAPRRSTEARRRSTSGRSCSRSSGSATSWRTPRSRSRRPSSTGRRRSARSPPTSSRQGARSPGSSPAGTTRGPGDDRVDRAVARPLLRRSPRQRPRGGRAPESARAARPRSSAEFGRRGLLRNRGGKTSKRRSSMNRSATGWPRERVSARKLWAARARASPR